MINTEHHVDHIFGNYFFTGAGQVVHPQGVYDNFMTVYPGLDPFAYAAEAIPVDDPDGTALFPDRDEYYRNPNKGTIVFTGDLTLRVGEHTFNLLHTPLPRSPCMSPRNASCSPATRSSANAKPGS